MCLCKFGQNPPIGSGDKVQTMSSEEANRIPTKSNTSPLPFSWGDIMTWICSHQWHVSKWSEGIRKKLWHVKFEVAKTFSERCKPLSVYEGLKIHWATRSSKSPNGGNSGPVIQNLWLSDQYYHFHSKYQLDPSSVLEEIISTTPHPFYNMVLL